MVINESKNKISILGGMILTISLLFSNFVEYRPNRVFSGIPLSAQDLFGNFFYLLLLTSFFILAFALLNPKKYRRIVGFLSFSMATIPVYVLGIASRGETLNALPNGRVSIGTGFWLLFLGIYMVISGSFEGYAKAVLYRKLFYLALFLMILLFLLSGHLNSLSIMKEFFNRDQAFFQQINRHFSLSFFSVMMGVLIGIPTGVLIYKKQRANSPILFLINLGQTIPTLSLLGLIMVPLAFLSDQSEFLKNIGIRGVGFAPAFIVLVIYSLFPIVHNTIAGLKLVDQDLLEVANGMGMKSAQTFWKIQLPLSLPVILGGIRTAMTQSIGNTILAGLIGGGGLGSIIFLGLAQAAPDLILLGVIPLIVMAFILDSLISFSILLYQKRYFGLML